MRVNLTAAFAEYVKPPVKGRAEYFDKRLPGFALRITDKGHKSWTLLYRPRGQKRLRRLTLGRFPRLSLGDARDVARKKLAEIQLGKDPAAEWREGKSDLSFEQLAQLYMEKHAKPSKRTWRKDERMLNRDLLPGWRRRKAKEIKRSDVLEVLDSIVERGSPIAANRTKALISKIFNFAVGRGVIEISPAYQIDRPSREHRRDRILTEDEIRTIWHALDDLNPKMASALRLALLTAQRRGEILGMRWSELDLAEGWWTLPAERAKNGLSHRVPLGPQALATLRERRPLARTEFVFPGGQPGLSFSNPQKHMRRLRQRTNIDFRFHDLRRTAASLMTGLGVPRLVVSKILNHADSGITAVYDRHSYDAEKQSALMEWDCRLAQIVSSAARGASGIDECRRTGVQQKLAMSEPRSSRPPA